MDILHLINLITGFQGIDVGKLKNVLDRTMFYSTPCLSFYVTTAGDALRGTATNKKDDIFTTQTQFKQGGLFIYSSLLYQAH